MRAKDAIAVGIDENTALYGDGEHWRVLGSGSVWISANGNDLSPHGDGDTIDLRLL
jgi:cyanophycinase-like exopeptidase